MTVYENKSYSELRYGITGELLRSYAVHILIYSLGVAMLSGVGYILGHSRIWYGTEPLYPLFHVIQQEWLVFFLFALLAGCLVITGLHFFRFARMLERITAAVSDMAGQRVSYIHLPPQLHQVQGELNQILNRMQQEARAAKEAEQRKNDMIMYMAHDLKTPLTSVIGYLSLLCEEQDISPQVRQRYQEIALRKAQRLEELCNEFFEITKYNFSHMILSLRQVNLSMMLEQLIMEFQPIFREKGLECQMDIVPELSICCDVDKLERVFDNLFKNAVYYSYENTPIHVSLRPIEEGVLFEIQNRGRTIPQEKLERLFQQFYRLDVSRSSSTGGSGLGLAIAKEIVELHQGTIFCTSQKETITFRVYLPGTDVRKS